MPNPVPQHNPTDGLGVSAIINLSGGTGASALSTIVAGREYAITLSKSAQGTYTASAALTAALADIGNNPYAATALTLSAAANASAGTTVYTGTITGGGSNAFAGLWFVVSGFDLSANNGLFLCTASTTTTLTLANAGGLSDTHAAVASLGSFSAVSEDGYPTGSPSWYRPSNYGSYSSNIASVAVSGNNGSTVTITSQNLGQCVVEVDFPIYDSPNLLGKIYCRVTVTVIP